MTQSKNKILLLSASLLSFQAHAMDSYDIIEHVYDNKITYSSGIFNYYKDGSTLSTQAQRPQKAWNQNSLVYAKKSQEFTPEAVLKKVVPGKDGRERISNTTTWPYSIYTQLSMVFDGADYGGSGVMVGPHHLLTCGHCVYNFDKKFFFNEISVYPALNGKVAPFDKVKVTKSYLFKSWRDQGNQQFDMALLLLDKPIGDYVGWGSLLSTANLDLSQEKVHITGYPGDKGFKQMWSMSHNIKTLKPEQFDYEIDTYGGQSGSAVWINKWGTPMILGVHTLGSDSMNSGVRLSGKKFTDLLLKGISDTYTINHNIEKPTLGVFATTSPLERAADITISPNKSNFSEENLQEKCEEFKKHAANLDNLTSFHGPKIGWGALCEVARKEGKNLWELKYQCDICDNSEEQALDKFFVRTNAWLFNDKPITRIVNCYKDIFKEMEEYRVLTGMSHSRWNEFSKM